MGTVRRSALRCGWARWARRLGTRGWVTAGRGKVEGEGNGVWGGSGRGRGLASRGRLHGVRARWAGAGCRVRGRSRALGRAPSARPPPVDSRSPWLTHSTIFSSCRGPTAAPAAPPSTRGRPAEGAPRLAPLPPPPAAALAVAGLRLRFTPPPPPSRPDTACSHQPPARPAAKASRPLTTASARMKRRRRTETTCAEFLASAWHEEGVFCRAGKTHGTFNNVKP